jgi:hypothetical protein
MASIPSSDRVTYLYKAFNVTINGIIDGIFTPEFLKEKFGVEKDPQSLVKLKEHIRTEAVVCESKVQFLAILATELCFGCLCQRNSAFTCVVFPPTWWLASLVFFMQALHVQVIYLLFLTLWSCTNCSGDLSGLVDFFW